MVQDDGTLGQAVIIDKDAVASKEVVASNGITVAVAVDMPSIEDVSLTVGIVPGGDVNAVENVVVIAAALVSLKDGPYHHADPQLTSK